MIVTTSGMGRNEDGSGGSPRKKLEITGDRHMDGRRACAMET
jgi:hypothetical protein